MSKNDLHGTTRTVVHDGRLVSISFSRYELEILDGMDAGRTLPIHHRVATLGTDSANRVVLRDRTVSRIHARIEADQGGYRLCDLDSKNGSFVQDHRIRDIYLNNKTTFRLGETALRFLLQGERVDVSFSPMDSFEELIGTSLSMREVFGMLERVAPTELTVLVEGESGTGKELVARALHKRSQRSGGPLVVFDCGAVARNLMESELFGHVKGAFTGATENRMGAFQQAHGGTIFLDEIGELEPELQPKLLRVIETQEVKPVGSNRPIKVDVRVVAATNRNLFEEVHQGSFREDLFYRLAVIQVTLPPLRDRIEDIPLLIRHFVRQTGKDPDATPLSYETMARLKAHPWSGNVRELKNYVERATILAQDGGLDPSYLHTPRMPRQNEDSAPVMLDTPFKEAKESLVTWFEKKYWKSLLSRTGGNISRASRVAGIHRKTAEALVRKLGLG